MSTTNSYRGTPFHTYCTVVENDPGIMSSTKVEVFRESKKIGEYLRLFPNFVKQTFCPFRVGEEWYALYSADYTATRVAKLTEDEFIDWCGEEGGTFGFCPVDFYVPRYKVFKVVVSNGKEYAVTDFDNEYPEDEIDEYFGNQGRLHQQYEGEFWTNYGFLSGCIWGDDSSWKLRFIDLSEVPNKVLKIDERFGYFELPGNLSLKQCIRNVGKDDFSLIQERSFSLEEGKFWDED